MMYGISHLRNLVPYIIIVLTLFNLLLNISLAEHISASETNKESDSDPVNKENQQDTTLFSDSSTSVTMTFAAFTATSPAATESDDEQSQCNPKISRCPGNRLPSPEDCSCLAMAGEKCGFNTRKRCDQNLGLRCIPERKSSLSKSYGVCRGQYNVQVVSTSYSNVSLKWDNFKPHGYSYEYVILYRETFVPDVWLWHSNACGPEPEAVVHGLKVNQGYFFRVTVWKDPVNQLYGNITEAVYAKTKAGCIFQGKTYQVGQLYEVNCEDICKCMSDGKFACEPVCPEERHNPKINNPLFKCTRELIGQSECCYATVCEPIDMENCESGNMTFGNGEHWNVGCQKRCVCQKGHILCQPLCQESKIDLNQCPHPIERYVKGECCPIRECLRKEETCVYKNEIHTKLKPFLSNDCQLCICDTNNDIICHPLRCAPVPEIIRMKPTPICPNPQKQKNKCCETIYCQNPLSTNSNAVSNLAAYVKNPRSLIISFTPPFSGQLRKQLIGYEIQHATQTQNGTTTIVWSTEFFNASSTKQQAISSSIDRLFEKQTIKYTDVLGQHFSSKKQQLSLNISTPEDVFVQVNYLQPGTKYYIRIRVRIDVEKTQNYRHRFFEENVESRNINSRRNNAMPVEELISADKKEQVKRVLTPFSQIISVSTPAKGLGCYTDTQWLSEGETFNRSCSETCTCKNGDVVCKYICPPLKIVYPTDTCPNPRIETVAGVCCPQRKCNHTKANCKHQNVTLKHGDTIRDGCNEVCSCHDGMLVCRKLCHTNAPSIVNGCVQIYMPTHCCPVWICEQEKRPYTSALLSSVLRLKGGCSPSDKTITNAVRKSVLDRTVNDHSIELVAPIAFKVQVTCNGGNTSDGNQQKDGQFDLMMHLQWKINLKNTVERVNGTAELWKTVNRTVVALTNTQFRIMVGQSSYGPAVSEGNPELTYLCDVGFLKTESGCVKYENVDDTISNNIDLHFVVSILRRTSCLLEWHQLTTRSQNSTRALYVVHRERATNPANWTWSEALNSTTVHYKLESLLPGKRYEAGLMWLPNIHSTKRFLLTSLHFKTKLKRVTPDNHTAMKIATPLCVVIILIIAGVSIYLMWKRHHKMRKKTETTYYENKGFWIGMMEGQRNSMTS